MNGRKKGQVKNAFNSARRINMVQSLEQSFRIPRYLGKVRKDYLRYRKLLNDRRERVISANMRKGWFLDLTFEMSFTTV